MRTKHIRIVCEVCQAVVLLSMEPSDIKDFFEEATALIKRNAFLTAWPEISQTNGYGAYLLPQIVVHDKEDSRERVATLTFVMDQRGRYCAAISSNGYRRLDGPLKFFDDLPLAVTWMAKELHASESSNPEVEEAVNMLLEASPKPFVRFYKDVEKGITPDVALSYECLSVIIPVYERIIASNSKSANVDPSYKERAADLVKRLELTLIHMKKALVSKDPNVMMIAVDQAVNTIHYYETMLSHIPDTEEEYAEVHSLLLSLDRDVIDDRPRGMY